MTSRTELLESIAAGRAASSLLAEAEAGPAAALAAMIDDLGRTALDVPAEDAGRTTVLKARREGLLLFKATLEGLAAAGVEAEQALAVLDGQPAQTVPGRLA